MSFEASKGACPSAWLAVAATLLWLGCNEGPPGGEEGLRSQGLESQALVTLAGSRWTSTGSMAERRRDHTATLLRDGKVLVVGGRGNSNTLAYNSAELYDPATGLWTPVIRSMTEARSHHTATLLRNGKVLVVGGAGSTGARLTSAELYDPANGTWTPAGSLSTARDSHTATLLKNGKVLIVGGINTNGWLKSVELYDPDDGNGTWVTQPNLNESRYGHTATLLQNGKVLVTGGELPGNPSPGHGSTETYDPATGSWTRTANMNEGRFHHTATLLPDGKVLVVGGQFRNEVPIIIGTAGACDARRRAEVYDPNVNPGAGAWVPVGSLGQSRSEHMAVLLASGKVLVAGGRGFDPDAVREPPYTDNCVLRGPFNSSEAYNQGSWATGSPPVGARTRHTMTLLPNGKVLVAGGWDGGGAVHNSAELYDPGDERWTASNAPAPSPIDASATLLPDGKVLVAGGQAPQGATLASSSTYDPEADSFTNTATSLNAPRAQHTATLLVTGKVLVVGGKSTNGPLDSAELYDPANRQWAPLDTASLAESRSRHTATLLPGGPVLIAGGEGPGGVLDSAEVYDPDHRQFTATGLMKRPRSLHTATPLPEGKVLVVGGKGPSDAALDSVELYDSATRQWTLLPSSLAEGRWLHTTTLLPGGRVLIVGGRNSGGVLDGVELYDVARGRWADIGSLNQPRFGHTTTLLPSGRVLVAGGYDASGAPLQSAELYDPVTRQWTSTANMAAARSNHTATVLPSGKVFVFGGGSNARAEVFDDLSVCPQCRPVLNPLPAPQVPGALLTLTGTHLSGVSEGGNGTTQSSATNFPVLHLRAVEGGALLRLEPQLPSADNELRVQLPQVPDGYYLLSVTANAASGSTMLRVDGPPLAAPELTAPTDGSFVNTTQPGIKGRTAPERRVTVWLNGSLAGTTLAAPSGEWAFHPTTQLSQGRYEATATAMDSVGNVSAPSTPLAFNVDTLAPELPQVIAPGERVNTQTPTVAGRAERRSTVTVSVDGTVVGKCTADVMGSWSLPLTTALVDGLHRATATATDAAGNASPPSEPRGFTVDTQAPKSPHVSAPGRFVNTQKPVIAGTAEAGSSVTVRLAGTVLGTAMASPSGDWALTPDTALAEKDHHITATATDAVGNVSPPSTPHLFTVDTHAPLAPSLSALRKFVNTQKPIIAGTAEPRSSVTVWLNETESLGTVIANSSGDWALIPATELQELASTYSVKATATDEAGNASVDSSSRSFKVDITAPRPPTVSNPGAFVNTSVAFVNDQTPTFRGTAEKFSEVTILVDGAKVGSLQTQEDEKWSITLQQDLGEGFHQLKITATDEAGNESAPAGASRLTVDTMSPSAPTVSGPAEFVNIRNPVIRGTAEAGTTVTVRMNGDEVGSPQVDEKGEWTYFPQGLLENVYVVTVLATDAAGNRSLPSFPYEFSVDLTPPQPPEVNGPAAFVNVREPVIRGTAEPGSTVTVWLDGSQVRTVKTEAKTWLYSPTEQLSSGRHEVWAVARDAAGNVSKESSGYSFIIDLERPPAPTVSAPGAWVSTPQPVISGTAEPGSTVTVMEVDINTLEKVQEVGEATADKDGNWRLTPLIEFEAGQHTVTATAQDPALNRSVDSAPQRFLVQESHYGWGCSSSTASPVTWALLVLAGALGRRRLRAP